jgi:putative membrane protein
MNSSLMAGIAIVLFSIPSYWYLVRSIGIKRSTAVILLLHLFAVGIETFAIKTGIPYGRFHYSTDLGFLLFGTTPWSVGFSWSMIILGAAALISQSPRFYKMKVLSTCLLLLLIDVVLDPGAVALGYWNYELSHGFYSVPWQNFLGWIVSGSLGSVLLYYCLKNKIKKQVSISLLLILIFYTGVDLYFHLWIPAVMGMLLSTLTVWVLVFSKASDYSKESVNN